MKRPLSITIISWVFVVGNSIVLISGLLPPGQRLNELVQNPIESGSVHLVRMIGIICGVFMLRGCNWARWLLAGWLAFHVAICVFSREWIGVSVHGLLMAVIMYFLFRSLTNAYFRSAKNI